MCHQFWMRRYWIAWMRLSNFPGERGWGVQGWWLEETRPNNRKGGFVFEGWLICFKHYTYIVISIAGTVLIGWSMVVFNVVYPKNGESFCSKSSEIGSFHGKAILRMGCIQMSSFQDSFLRQEEEHFKIYHKPWWILLFAVKIPPEIKDHDGY